MPALSEAITSVRSFFEREKQQQPINMNCCVARTSTAQCLGLSTRTVMRVTKKATEGTALPESDQRARAMTILHRCIPEVPGTEDYYGHVTLDLILEKLQAKRGQNGSGVDYLFLTF